ncbi:RNA polymerase-associated protein rtf1 [Emydomyces testavorans]|uniref:RNA polymerase-associated protein rtf1 n=1 Tax=Emydomyces testavorans TaxID=2070801 RepID=A0AAF0DK31_9EURO|nr:RNA polymerase-associated protein rtf1 [Emydomyces testavorans]
MADLDAELLALAGGDDSSDEETSMPVQSKASSPSHSPPKEEQPEDEDDEMARKGVARPVKQRKRAKDDDEEEEGELSSSSVHSRKSLNSASMSESEPEASPPPEDKQGPIFSYEKLFYSAKDKEDIMAMPEIQREELLSERAQLVDRHNQDIALRRLLAIREREGAKGTEKRKRKVSDAEGQRKSSRQKTTLGGRKVGETSDAIEAYKRQREQKGKRDEQRRRDASTKKKDEQTGSPEGSDIDAHGESEVEWDEAIRHRSVSAAKDDPPAELRDFERARVSRSNFAQYCFYPNFERLITGCYTRINVGPHPDTGELVYRLCLIKGFVEGRPYAIEGANGRKFVTKQYALLEHGNSKKDFPFIFCSDSPFTESEFSRYRQTMTVEGFKMPTKSVLAKKINDIHFLINYQLTKEELEEKLKRQGTHDNKMAVFERLQLQKRRQEAVASGDEAAIAECDAEIARLSGPKLAFGTSLVEPKSSEKTQQERLAELNRRNQKLNAENVRKAQLEERRAARLQQAAVARGEALPDRFARVKTRARTHYDANGNHLVPKKEDHGEISGSVTPLTAGANTPNKATPTRSATPMGVTKDTKPQTGIPKLRYAPNADEILAASLDFEIDIEI